MDASKIWTEEERKNIAYLWKQGYSTGAIAEKLDVSHDSARRQVRGLQKKGIIEKKIPMNSYGWIRDESKDVKPFTDWFRIKSSNIMIWGDSHVPFLNEDFTIKMFEMRKKFGTKDLLIVGDFFDEKAFCFFGVRYPLGWPEEKAFARIFMEQLLENFDRIWLLCGNHDLRILRKLEYNDTFSELVRSITNDKKVKASEYPICEINDSWVSCHAKSYSRVSGNIAKTLASKYRKNIILPHGHFTSLGFDISGKSVCIDVGGLVDKDKQEYVALHTTTHPTWNNGFLILLDNYPLLFHEKTDFSFWLDKVTLKNK